MESKIIKKPRILRFILSKLLKYYNPIFAKKNIGEMNLSFSDPIARFKINLFHAFEVPFFITQYFLPDSTEVSKGVHRVNKFLVFTLSVGKLEKIQFFVSQQCRRRHFDI